MAGEEQRRRGGDEYIPSFLTTVFALLTDPVDPAPQIPRLPSPCALFPHSTACPSRRWSWSVGPCPTPCLPPRPGPGKRPQNKAMNGCAYQPAYGYLTICLITATILYLERVQRRKYNNVWRTPLGANFLPASPHPSPFLQSYRLQQDITDRAMTKFQERTPPRPLLSSTTVSLGYRSRKNITHRATARVLQRTPPPNPHLSTTWYVTENTYWGKSLPGDQKHPLPSPDSPPYFPLKPSLAWTCWRQGMSDWQISLNLGRMLPVA